MAWVGSELSLLQFFPLLKSPHFAGPKVLLFLISLTRNISFSLTFSLLCFPTVPHDWGHTQSEAMIRRKKEDEDEQ
jgi:hypothetical protein